MFLIFGENLFYRCCNPYIQRIDRNNFVEIIRNNSEN